MVSVAGFMQIGLHASLAFQNITEFCPLRDSTSIPVSRRSPFGQIFIQFPDLKNPFPLACISLGSQWKVKIGPTAILGFGESTMEETANFHWDEFL